MFFVVFRTILYIGARVSGGIPLKTGSKLTQQLAYRGLYDTQNQ